MKQIKPFFKKEKGRLYCSRCRKDCPNSKSGKHCENCGSLFQRSIITIDSTGSYKEVIKNDN